MSTNCPTCHKPGFRKHDAMITVRLARSLHTELKLLAADRQCSLNELCIVALSRMVETETGINWEGVSERKPNRAKYGVRSGADHERVYD